MLQDFKKLAVRCCPSLKNWPKRRMTSRNTPVVVVLGCTGTGKSKLAVDIARRFNGEVISADSMQVYKGLDIITNKLSTYEMADVVHHMMDFVNPLDDYTVVDFQKKALPIINELLEKGKLPVVVGGTNYYIESLLWKVLITHQPDSTCSPEKFAKISTWQSDSSSETASALASTSSRNDTEDVSVKDGEPRSDSALCSDHDSISNSCLYKRLQEVDPEMAERLHPNDRRKILRSLEVYDRYGTTLTEILKEQKSVKGGSSLGGPLRFPNSCIFWLRCEQEVLDKRLNERVDDMMKRGLIQELQDFHLRYNKQRLIDQRHADYTRGIFQCIGFKEFHPYLLLTDRERQLSEADELLSEGVDTLKLVTRRYARKQIKWIVNRFLRCPDRQVPRVYALDATYPAHWDTTVSLPATEILTALLKSETPIAYPLAVRQTNGIDKRKQVYCEVCQKILQGEEQWLAHQKSRRHKNMKQKQLKHSVTTEVAHQGNARTVVDI